MPDITMCANKKCIAAEYCERSTAEPGEWQSFAFFGEDDDMEDGRCKHFWANDKAKIFEILAAPEVDRTNLMGYKGKVTADVGLIYAPYVPKSI